MRIFGFPMPSGRDIRKTKYRHLKLLRFCLNALYMLGKCKGYFRAMCQYVRDMTGTFLENVILRGTLRTYNEHVTEMQR